MLDFYFHGSPNSLKVALFLEEAGLEYNLRELDILNGDQHDPSYVAINPNAKLPAIVDDGVAVFDSNAILLHLAEKHGLFWPFDLAHRGAALSWLMFVASGIGPYSGQAMHFTRYAPDKIPYAINRYTKEVARHYAVLDRQIGNHPYILGEDYSIVDMAAWGWALFYEKFDPVGLTQYPSVSRWFDAISARPAARRAHALRQAKAPGTFDEKALAILFPQNN